MHKITHKNKKGVIMFRVVRVKKLYNIKKQVQFLEGQVQELIEKNDFLIKDMQAWETKNKQLFHEIVELRKSKSVLESENRRHKKHLLSAEKALIEKDEKLKRYAEIMSGIKKLIFKYSGKGKGIGMYDCGYKDGTNAGYKLALDDIVDRLHNFGLKTDVKFKSTKEYFENVIKLVEFYKLQYKRCLDEIAESHSSEEEEVDGTMCFVVSCGCEFCEQWRKLNKLEKIKNET
ncbi:MAG TPA: hypothetical protein VK982_04500 [Bacteroidales bacterium]|nr:hypothetical protein [Bacteroidales bacterium]